MMALLAPAVFLLSSAVLAFEILLLRLFAIETFHHFAHMAIGVALLGSGASGALLVLAAGWLRGRERRAFATLCAVTALALILAPAVTHMLGPLPGESGSGPGVAAAAALYLTLAAPFLVSGAAQAIALQLAGGRVGRVYAWNLLGAAAGTVLSLVLLSAFAPARAMAAAALPAAAAALLAAASRGRAAYGRRGLALTVAAAVLVLVAVVRPPWQPRVTEAKALARMEADPAAHRVAEEWGPAGWVVALDVPHFQHAPGLSLAYRGGVPPQVALFRDAELIGAATVYAGDPAALEFLHWLPSAAAYALGPTPPGNVLVIGPAAGLEALGALARGAGGVTLLETARALADAAEESVPPASRLLGDRRVSLVIADPRAYAAGTDRTFDVIALPASPAGNGIEPMPSALREDFVNTVEAYASYMRRLSPDGVLAITRWLTTPPRENVRTILTAAAALERLGQPGAADRLVLIRSWSTGTLLVKPAGFSHEELVRLRAFAAERFFDVDIAHDEEIPPPEHDVLARPVYEHALAAAAAGARHARAFAARYPHDVVPATDDHPYAGRAFTPADGGRRTAFDGEALRGNAIVATLMQSAAAAIVLLAIPMFVIARRQGAAGVRRVAIGRAAGYFAAIGFGFIFVEIAAIQRLSLLLGHPIYATAMTLAAVLAFSGIGSALSDRLPASASPVACLLVAAAAAVIAPTMHWTSAVDALPLAGRAAAALALVAVPGVLLGGPFPLGLRRLARGPEAVAWAWAANGIAAVVATSVAALLAMQLGARLLLVAGALCYLAAAFIARGSTQRASAAAGARPPA